MKDADPDIPVLKQAKAEYAKLQCCNSSFSVLSLAIDQPSHPT
jgi:hypothetical protein